MVIRKKTIRAETAIAPVLESFGRHNQNARKKNGT
jgi:hypothetical protein